MQVINTNLPALNTQRQLNRSQNDLQTAMQRLSSGLRVNSAKDDAAGLAIGNRMGAQVNGLDQATRNANDGISVAQVAEGALGEVTNALQRMRVLAVQSANGGNYTAADRASLQQEVSQLKDEIARLASQTKFNGLPLLDGTYRGVFQVGAYANEKLDFNISSVKPADFGSFEGVSNDRVGTMASYQVKTPAISSGPTSEITYPYKLPTTTIGTASASTAIWEFRASSQAHIGSVTAASALGTNGMQAGTLSIIVGPSTGSVTLASAGMSAKDIASVINTQAGNLGIHASAKTTATLSGLSASGSVSFNLNGASISATINDPADLSPLADAINNNTLLSGITATASGGTLTLTDSEGNDIKIENFTADGTIKVEGVTLTTGDSTVIGGQLTVQSDQPFTINGGVTGLGTISAPTGTRIDDNGVASQTLTINGLTAQAISVSAGMSAQQIAAAVNNASGSTGVSATASTSVTLANLSSGVGAGDPIRLVINQRVVSLTLASGSPFLKQVADAINDANTGVVATYYNNDSIILSNPYGADIEIESFAAGTNGTIQVTATNGDNLSSPVTLTTDDGTGAPEADSIVVGGKLQFQSKTSFYLTSNVNYGGIVPDIANYPAIAQKNAQQGNGVAAQTMMISSALTASAQSISIPENASAKDIAALVNAASGTTGVSATATTEVDLSGFVPGKVSFTLYTGSGTTLQSMPINVGLGNANDLSPLVSAINDAGLGLTAEVSPDGTTLKIKSADGSDIGIGDFLTKDNPVIIDDFGDPVAIALTVSAPTWSAPQTITSGSDSDSILVAGSVKFSALVPYSVQTDAPGGSPLLSTALNADDTSRVLNPPNGNGVAAQTITVNGRFASTDFTIPANASARQIADIINNGAQKNGVSATARTQVTLSNLAAAGKVTFGLSGQNGTPVPITATISDPNDLSPLAKEINAYSDQTGIRAELSTDRKSLTLISDKGDDIKVTNFQLGDTATEAGVIQVDGVPLNEIGALDKEGNLIGTGGFVAAGKVSFHSSFDFTVTSTDTANTVFKSPIDGTLSSVQDIDISTVDGADLAIRVLDGALDFVSEVRGKLGAVQNRFSAVVSGNQATSENVTSARSRIMDADYAAETAALARAQILQQAGTAMLAQANALPQNVLQLLR